MPAGGRVTGVEATRLYRSVMKPLYWCPSLATYVVGDPGLCPEEARPVRLTPPGDVRPASSHDAAVTRRAVEETVGRRAARKLLPGGLLLLNRVQAVDAADEVVAGGVVVGTRLYEPLEKRWVFKPDWWGAVLVVEEKLGYYAIVRRGLLRAGRLLEKSNVVEGELPPPGLYVALGDGSGAYGVAKVTRSGRLRVLRSWRPRGPVVEPVRARGREALVEANAPRLERLEREAVEFLERVKGLGEAMVALSGGKDSTVAAALAAMAGIRRAYFFDTGIEFPETVETARRAAEALGLDLLDIGAGDTFWRALRLFGPPARDYRWCCKVVKFAPLARALKPLVKTRLVTVTGQRGFESTQRARAGRLAPSATTGRRDLLAAPIQEWTSLDVYAYIWSRGLPLNPLYEMGYERIGCYLCPTSRLAEIENAKRTHPGLWGRWEDYLYSYARRRGLPREWVEYGFWRWRFSYPAEVEEMARRLGLRPGEMLEKLVASHVGSSVEYGREGECTVLYLHDVSHDPREVYDLLAATGLRERARLEPDGTIVVVDEELGVTARLRPTGVLELCTRRREGLPRRRAAGLAWRLLAPAYMSGACYGCEVCVAACPTGAMVAAHTLDPGRCAGCSVCAHVCPSGGKLSYHAIRALDKLLSPREGRRRAKHGGGGVRGRG